MAEMPSSLPPSYLHEVVKRLREGKYTFEEVERRARRNISKNYVNQIENQKREGSSLSVEKIYWLARALGESPTVLFEAAIGKKPNTIADDTLKDLLERFAKLKHQDREKLRFIVEHLREQLDKIAPPD